MWVVKDDKSRVIGNVVRESSCQGRVRLQNGINLQFQEGQIRVTVVGLVFALLHHIVLEYGCCLGVVPVETI
jgi:hypothetical protein